MAKFITIYDKELDDTIAINLDKVYFVSSIDPHTTIISFDGEPWNDSIVWTVEKKNGNVEYYISRDDPKTMLLNMPLDQVLEIIYEAIR